MKYLYAIALLFTCLGMYAQFSDDFSDGDFTSNPAWSGETDKFTISAGNELQLYDAGESGSAYLSTPNAAINNAVWEFVVRYEFNPSSANYANIYLCSDNSDLTSDVHGYFVKIGNTSDEISLYRQDGSSSSEIIDGTDGRVDSDPVNVRIRVSRDGAGNWILASDTLGGTDFFEEGTAFDNTYISSQYFGVACTFSSTRWDKIFFDDFIVTGDPYSDDIAPELEGYELLGDTELVLFFSEPMDENSSLDVLNYQVSGGLGNPESAEFYNGNPSEVLLTFSSAIVPNTLYTLLYQGMEDLYGNEISSGSFEFSLVEMEAYDVVFNEIMADPTPVVNLPDAEYLELYNRTDMPINLSGWKLIIGTSIYNFPSSSIESNGYLILCRDVDEAAFSPYGETAAFSEFSTYTLTNGGASLELRDSDSLLVDHVTYSDDWYQDPDKDDGGWSLERIDPENHCSGMSNWGASVNQNGGSPGSINSIDGDNMDETAPEVLGWEISSGNEISLKFSETPDSSTWQDYSNFYLSPDYGEPLFIEADENDPLQIRLQFVAALQEDVLYTLNVQNIADVCGNIMPDTTLTVINFVAETFDVLISEIMADPNPVVFLPEVEYVELHNNAEFPVNPAGWVFVSGSTGVVLPATEIPVGGYVCLVDADDVNEFTGIENVLPVDNMPSLGNTTGELQLISKEGKLVHFVNYSRNWYESPVKQEGGWSLEMIDDNNPCGTFDNWSESVSETGGTPGAVNSVEGDSPDNSSPEVLRAIAYEPDTLMVYFEESLHPDLLVDSSKYIVDNTIGEAVSVSRPEGLMNALQLVFSNAFEEGIIYELSIRDEIRDCAGNSMEEIARVNFALPDSVEAGDIVINEVLFNPYDGASDYVELYNRSDKFISLSDLRLATRDDSLMIEDMEALTEIGYMLFPGEFVVLSEDIASVSQNYYCKDPGFLLEAGNLPSYGNESGYVVLCAKNMEVIDEMYYHEDMHFQLLKDLNGVALERVDYERSSADENNWHSAAETAGFGTPTYQNSQYLAETSGQSLFELTPESISPDNDGYQDYLTIRYRMDKAGYVMSIDIYDAAGHFIRKLADNELMSAEGSFLWDGLDENNQHPGAGVYIILLDYFDLDGNRHQEKHTCVLAVMR